MKTRRKCKKFQKREEFTKIIRDSTQRIQTNKNYYINEIKNNNIIDEQDKLKLITYIFICPRIYGNPKIHKDGIPLGPIIAGVTSPTINLAQFLTKILKRAYNTENSTMSKIHFIL